MEARGWFWVLRRLASGVLVATLALSSGCMSVFHPVRPPDWTVAAPPPVLPRCCQDHVYVFFIHGLDPLDYANLSGMRQYVHDLGYCQTYYGQVYHGPTFLKEIRRIRHEDPEAHFVLIGFSAGANVVRSMANQLGEEGTQVDLLVYMGGNTLEDVPENRPANVCKVVHILGSGYIWRGHQLTGAENIKYPDKWHFDSPTHPETLRKLGDELSMISCKVPVIVPVYPAQPEEIPLPRPVDPVRSASTSSPEWDFLKARTALSAPNSRWEKPEETANPAALSGRTRPARVTSR